MDQEMVPIEGADVGVVGQAKLAAKTDAAGRFTLNEVAPGNYNLIAQRLGFDAASKAIMVVAGEVTPVNFSLVAIATAGPTHQLIPYNGFLNLGGSVGVREGAAYTVYFNDANTRMFFETNVTKGLTAVIDGMRWGSSAPLTTKWFMLDMQVDGVRKNRTSGASPLVERLDDLEITKKGKIGHQVWVAWGSVSEPASAAVVVYQQKFELYTTVFYGGPIPDGYDPFPSA